MSDCSSIPPPPPFPLMTATDENITFIRPGRGWFDIDWKGIWSYRELLWLLAKRDVSVVYKQTILGPVWFLLQPVLTSVVFAVIFGRIAKIATAGLPRMVYYMGGLLLWNYFKGIMEGAGKSFVSYKPLFSKVYFPRLVAPLSLVLSNLVYFGLNLVIFLGFYIYFFNKGFDMRPNASLLALPLLLLHTACTGLGTGLWLAALTSKYRDLRFAMPFLTQCWMYATPIIYPITGVVEPSYKVILFLNPLTMAVESLRFMFTGVGVITWSGVATGVAVSLALLVTGIGVFNRYQRTFVDVV